MYRVTFYLRGGSYRSKSYQREAGAKKAIWKWLREKPEADNAVLFSPESGTQTFTDWRELPFEDNPKETDFYRSNAWLKLRTQAFEKYGNRCACCGVTPTQDPNVRLHVDHIKPRSIHSELALDINNLQILCEACNLGKSNWSEKQWRD
jgi:hypothetical protein